MNVTGNNLFSLSNKTILITGGTRGIGKAVSLRFARAGATVIANYLRNEEAAEQLKAIASQEHLAIRVCRADLTSERVLEELDRSLQECGPHLSGMVHCAVTGIHRPLEELTERHFDWTLNLNVRAFFKLTKLLLARFPKGQAWSQLVPGAPRVPYRSIRWLELLRVLSSRLRATSPSNLLHAASA